MLDRVVRHLRSHAVPFKLFSHPSAEALPMVAHAPPRGGVLVETRVLLLGSRPAIAVVPRGAKLNLPRLRHELGVVAAEGTIADLPAPYSSADGFVPPTGDTGALVLVDEVVTRAAVIVFAALSSTDFIEVAYDDYARLERPRVASFADGGELPEHLTAAEREGEPARKSA